MQIPIHLFRGLLKRRRANLRGPEKIPVRDPDHQTWPVEPWKWPRFPHLHHIDKFESIDSAQVDVCKRDPRTLSHAGLSFGEVQPDPIQRKMSGVPATARV